MVAVPQLSGRGLGHTGGTLDKLEAIPGWRAALSTGEMLEQLEQVGAVICAAGSGLAPADKKLYALRDVTGTVESILLIASSIMSKKIAEGTGALVLDVKVGSGAFMKNAEDARRLAETMVELGRRGSADGGPTHRHGDPLAGPPATRSRWPSPSRCWPGWTVRRGGADRDGSGDAGGRRTGRGRPAEMLASGAAMDAWRAMIQAQGGDPDAVLPGAAEVEVVTAETDGVLLSLDAMAVGLAAWRLGAGRSRPGEAVQAAAGVELHAKPGDRVRAGQPLLSLHTDTPERIPRARQALEGAIRHR